MGKKLKKQWKALHKEVLGFKPRKERDMKEASATLESPETNKSSGNSFRVVELGSGEKEMVAIDPQKGPILKDAKGALSFFITEGWPIGVKEETRMFQRETPTWEQMSVGKQQILIEQVAQLN